MLKRLIFGALLLFACSAVSNAQGFRVGPSTVSSSLVTAGPISTAQGTLAVCAHPANAVPCTNKVNTYTDVTLATPCSTATQVVLDGTSTCVATSDAKGNYGFYIGAGTFDYTITVSTGQSFGPYVVSLGVPTGMSITPSTISGVAFSIASAPTGATESGNTVTITTTATCTFTTNQAVTISGVGVSGYNGSFVVLTPGCNGGSTFTYTNATIGLGTSGGGTATGSPVFPNGLTSTGPENHTGPVTITGNLTATGLTTFNNAAAAGADDLKFGLINHSRWNCAGAGFRFPTIESALSDIQTNATQGGFILTCPDNATDTSPGLVDIGSATKTAVVELHPGNQWLDNTSTAHAYFLGIHNASALVGANNGAIGGSRTGGAYIKLGCSANITGSAISTVEGLSAQQGYGYMSHIFGEGCPTGTVGTGSPAVAFLNIEGISSMNQWDNSQFFNFANTIGIRVASNNVGGNNAVVGPIVLTNMWSDGNYNAGNQPWKITATSGSCAGVLPISVIGGVANHPASGLPLFEVNGQGATCSGAIFGGSVTGFYTENQLNGSSTHFKMTDANNYNFAGIASATQNTDTLIGITQASAGKSANLTFQNMRQSGTGTTVSNSISGFSESAKTYLPLYHFGGDSSASFYPMVIDWNQLWIRPNAANTALLVKNQQDNAMEAIDLDSGSTATQSASLYLLDRGTKEWSIDKDSGNVFDVFDRVNNVNRLQFFQNASSAGVTRLNSASTGAVTLNVLNGTGTGGTQFGNGAGLAIGWVDSSGNIFFHCATVTLQNCGKLTGSFTGGATSRDYNFADSATCTGAACTVAATTGTLTAGDSVKINATGQLVDSGSPPVGFTCVNVTPVTTSGGSVTTDQNMQACTIPANTLNAVGKTLMIQTAGVYSTPAASTTAVTLKIKLCSVSGCASGNVATLVNISSTALAGIQATNDPFNVQIMASTTTAGASSAAEAHGNLTIDISALTTAAEGVFADGNTATISGSPSAIDLTAQNFLQVSVAFTAASASNVATGRQLIVDVVD